MKVWSIKYHQLLFTGERATGLTCRYAEVGAPTKGKAIKIFESTHPYTRVVNIALKREK